MKIDKGSVDKKQAQTGAKHLNFKSGSEMCFNLTSDKMSSKKKTASGEKRVNFSIKMCQFPQSDYSFNERILLLRSYNR